MEKEVSLTDIETIIDSYTKQKPYDLSSFPWLQDKLSFFSRILGFFSGTKSPFWQKRYVLPVIAVFSRPYLYRFYEGDWKAYEEMRLKGLFNFFSEHCFECQEAFSPELQIFLKGTPPSFLRERERLQVYSREGVWGRNETFSEYKKRLQGLFQLEHREKGGGERLIPQEKEEIIPLSERTKGLLDSLLEKLQAFREKCLECVSQLEKEQAKVFPVRLEAERLVRDMDIHDEKLSRLIQETEREIARLSEMNSNPCEGQALALIDEGSLFLCNASGSLQNIRKELLDVRPRLDEVRSLLNKDLSDIVHSIDHVLLLPATSVFRPRQARIVRMARDKVKKFKESLTYGPGPGITLVSLEKEVHLLTQLADEFYEEGKDIEVTREKLSFFEEQLKKIIHQETDHKRHVLMALLEEIQTLQKTLEVAPDRKAHVHKIYNALAEVGISRDIANLS